MAKVNENLQDLTVEFKVTGPFPIFKGHAKIARARMDQTWMDFLMNTCQLPIPRQGEYHIGSKTPGQSWEWTARLNEKIGEFVKKFEQRRDQYSVVLISGTQEVAGMTPVPVAHDSAKAESTEGENLRKKPQCSSPVAEGDGDTVDSGLNVKQVLAIAATVASELGVIGKLRMQMVEDDSASSDSSNVKAPIIAAKPPIVVNVKIGFADDDENAARVVEDDIPSHEIKVLFKPKPGAGLLSLKMIGMRDHNVQLEIVTAEPKEEMEGATGNDVKARFLQNLEQLSNTD